MNSVHRTLRAVATILLSLSCGALVLFWPDWQAQIGGYYYYYSNCGNNVVDQGEQCDGGDDGACPWLCRKDCTCADHFQCYKTKPSKAPRGQAPFPRFSPRAVTLLDQFEERIVDVKKSERICNPVSKAGEGIHNPSEHLVGYLIKDAKLSPKQAKFERSRHTVLNQFGRLVVDVIKPVRLLVPSNKVLGQSPPLPPLPGRADHYKCYRVKTAKARKGEPRLPRFKRINLTLDDDFGSVLATIKKPTILCNPVDKSGSGFVDPTAHLMCYKVRLTKTRPKQEKFVKRTISINNQFSPEVLVATSLAEMCVPSVKDPPSGVFEDLKPCDSGDEWEFGAGEGQVVSVMVDSADSESTADFCFTADCGEFFLDGDDEIRCSFPPESFACPRAKASVPSDTTCRLIVTTCSNTCADPASARYELSVTLDGVPAPLNLVQDDG